MHILKTIKRSIVWVTTVPFSVVSLIVGFINLDGEVTMSVCIPAISISIFFLMIAFFGHMLITIYQSVSNNATNMFAIIIEDNRIILLFEKNISFTTNSLVTVYRRKTYNSHCYEQAFCTGHVQNIQQDGIIQVQFVQPLNCTDDDLEKLKSQSKEIIDELFAKPITHYKFEGGNQNAQPNHQKEHVLSSRQDI